MTKLQLGVNIQNYSGYITVDPIPGPDKEIGDFKNVDRFVEDAECDEILAETLVDFIPANQMIETLKHYVAKLRHGGRFIIGGTDIIEVAKAIVTQRLSVPDANRILHGGGQHAWDIREGQSSLFVVRGLLEEMGLTVVKTRINKFHYVVEGVRP